METLILKQKIALSKVPFIILFMGTTIANLSLISMAVYFHIKGITLSPKFGELFIVYWLAAAIGSLIFWFILGIMFEPHKMVRKASIVLGTTIIIIYLTSWLLFKSYFLVITIGILIFVLLGFTWRLFRHAQI